jgi:hypothetical protein
VKLRSIKVKVSLYNAIQLSFGETPPEAEVVLLTIGGIQPFRSGHCANRLRRCSAVSVPSPSTSPTTTITTSVTVIPAALLIPSISTTPTLEAALTLILVLIEALALKATLGLLLTEPWISTLMEVVPVRVAILLVEVVGIGWHRSHI